MPDSCTAILVLYRPRQQRQKQVKYIYISNKCVDTTLSWYNDIGKFNVENRVNVGINVVNVQVNQSQVSTSLWTALEDCSVALLGQLRLGLHELLRGFIAVSSWKRTSEYVTMKQHKRLWVRRSRDLLSPWATWRYTWACTSHPTTLLESNSKVDFQYSFWLYWAFSSRIKRYFGNLNQRSTAQKPSTVGFERPR